MIVNGVQQPWEFALPSGWKRKRLKFYTFMKGRLGWQKLTRDEYADSGPLLVSSEHFTNDKVDWARCNRVTHERFAMAPEIHLHPHDVLFMKDGAAMGKLAYVHDLPEPGCLNSHLLVLRPNRSVLLPRFLFYVLKTPCFEGYMVQERKGTTFFGFSQESMGNYPLAFPTQAAQRAIADFLDRKTRAIDELIRKKERLIELLQEKRQALITQAVTKGLDPNVPMKDSGVPWLGEIPAHWTVKKLRWVLRESPRNGVSPPTSGGATTPTFSIAAVRDGVVRIADNVKFAEITARGAFPFRVRRGDVLVMRGNGSFDLVGSAGIVDEEPPDGCIYPDILIRLRSGTAIRPRYLVSILNSRPLRAQVETSARTAAGIWKVSGGSLAAFQIPLPGVEEQDAILQHVTEATDKGRSVVDLVTGQLDHLREYRQALISAAVTGQIDVTGEAAA